MASLFTLGKEFLPFDSVRVGGLLGEKSSPLDFYEPPPEAVDPDVGVVVDVNSWELDSSERGKSIYAKFVKYMSLSYSGRHSRRSEVSTSCVKTYMLKNSEKYLDDIIELEETKKFLERVLKSGGEPCLIVGFKTLKDAVIKEYDAGFQAADLEAGVNCARMGANVTRDDPILRTSTALGEQVCALQLRKVRVKTRKTKVKDATLLRGKEWYTLTTFRQAKIPEWYEVLEAEIGKSSDRDTFEFDDVEDDDWKKVEDEDADYYL